MIEESYVSLETARLLKEAGFDWKCEWFFTEKELLGHSSISENHNEIHEYGGCSRPTLSLAAKWLRKENNIYVEVIRKFICWKFSLINLNPVCIIKLTAGSFNTYEEALEEGLKEALERICKAKSST